jgi:hypothetical protein
MARRSARAALLVSLLLGACTSTPEPEPFQPAQLPAIRLGVQGVEVGSQAELPANMNFIARRWSEDLASEAQGFLRARLQATGGTEFARATVERASIIERARETSDGGVFSTEPSWEMAGNLAVKVAVVDGLGIEQSSASSRVEIRRSLSPRASVAEKDAFVRTLTKDLLEATSRELETSINQNLAAFRAP